MAISNRQHVPTMFTAGAAIAMCKHTLNPKVISNNFNSRIIGGERFTDPTEQQVLMDILVEAEAHVAWPSLRFQNILRGLWQIWIWLKETQHLRTIQVSHSSRRSLPSCVDVTRALRKLHGKSDAVRGWASTIQRQWRATRFYNKHDPFILPCRYSEGDQRVFA